MTQQRFIPDIWASEALEILRYPSVLMPPREPLTRAQRFRRTLRRWTPTGIRRRTHDHIHRNCDLW